MSTSIRLRLISPALAAALLAPACDTPRSGFFPVFDLAGVRDLTPRDFAQANPDLAMGGGPGDLATAPDDMAAPPPVDLAVVDVAMPRDLSIVPPGELGMPPADLATPPADLAAPPADLVMTPSDLAMTPSDLAMSPLDLVGAPWCKLIVNEVQVGTVQSASEEFVEFYNPCNVDVPLAGWTMVYRSAANANPIDATGDNTTKQFPQNASIKGQSYYVLCTTLFTGKCDSTYGMTGIMAAAGGGVGVRDPNAVLTDSVGYGTATNPFVEGGMGNAAPAPPVANSPGASIGRLPNAVDTNVNKNDWKATMMITPGAANQ